MFARTLWLTPGRLLLAMAVLGAVAAQAQSGAAAKAVSLTGRVSLLKDSTPWALNVGDLVQPRQTLVTGPDGFAVFKLSDGSTFEVYPNSKVEFRRNPSDWSGLLDVWIGRVKVYIQKLGLQPNHNKVTTPTAVISVRGTIFDVVVEDMDHTTLVSVEEGAVLVRHTRQVGERLLGAGEWIRVFKDQPLARAVDKGGLVQNVLRATAQALYEAIYRTGRTASSGAGSTGTSPVPGAGPPAPLPGDRGDDEAPPPPPPPPEP